MSEPTLGQIYDVVKISREEIGKVNTKLDDTITGLYGPLSDREKGIIPQHDKRLQHLEDAHETKKWLNRRIVATAIGFIVVAVLVAMKGIVGL